MEVVEEEYHDVVLGTVVDFSFCSVEVNSEKIVFSEITRLKIQKFVSTKSKICKHKFNIPSTPIAR